MEYQAVKFSPSLCLTIGVAVVAAGMLAHNLLQPKQQAVAHTESDLMLEMAIQSEGDRIAQWLAESAVTDPECSIDVNPIQFCLDRLKQENQSKLADAVFREQALKKAQEKINGGG